jgi:ribonuclease D
MGLLKDWRNRLVARNNAAPVTVAANGLLREIVRHAPRSVEELTRVPDIRQWQLEAHGEAIVAIVRTVAGEAAVAEDPAEGESAAPAGGKRRRRRGGSRSREGAAPESA